MRVIVSDDSVEVRLAPWEMVLGLMRSLTIARVDISDVEVIEDPMREAMRCGIKIGLRLPWLLYVARTMRLDQVLIVRRGVPGLSFAVSNHRYLQRVLLSTRQAEQLAKQLQSA